MYILSLLKKIPIYNIFLLISDVIKKLVFKFIKLFYIFEKYIINLYYILYKQIWKNLNRVVLKIYTINEKRIYNGKNKRM